MCVLTINNKIYLQLINICNIKFDREELCFSKFKMVY